MRDALDHGAVGGCGGNDLEKPEIARRVEEMRAQPMPSKIVAAAFRERRDPLVAGPAEVEFFLSVTE